MIKTKEKGLLIVVSGPSGCGKSTLDQLLLKKRKNIVMSISDTTRNIRGNEVDGVDYNFISVEEFENNIDKDKYLEYALVHSGKYYGTPVDFVNKNLDKGNDVILEIDIEGARKVNEKRSDAVFIFIMPPSMKILKQRLVSRKTETKEQVVERFKTAYKEINEVSKYNYVIVNDNVDEALDKMDAIITCEKCRVDRIEDVDLGNQEEIIHEILMDM
jgi:guanylate kinase